MTGGEMYDLCRRLWPYPRSLTGEGNRKTLDVLGDRIPLERHSVPSGAKVFDWRVPPEWSVREAWVETPDGRKVANASLNPLHLVGYSNPALTTVDRMELDEHLYSLPDQPDAIPYVTNYYSDGWGFCISDRERRSLPDTGEFRAVVKTQLNYNGRLDYADLVLPGPSTDEVLFSTYICHPMQANDGLSGIAVLTALAEWLMHRSTRYTYRFVFVPETIGAICYLADNLQHVKEHVVAGLVATTCGDPGGFGYVPTRQGGTLTDRAARKVMDDRGEPWTWWGYLDRASDERQYNSPGVGLPVGSIVRSKYETYPEYHTSADDLDFITPEALSETLEVYKSFVRALEHDTRTQVAMPCEPQLGKRGLYQSTNEGGVDDYSRKMRDLLAYADGRGLLEIAEKADLTVDEAIRLREDAREGGVLEAENE